MKIKINELQGQIRRGPGVVIGPGITTSGSREVECLKHLKTVFPHFETETQSPTYLDYADLILASGSVKETNVRAQVEEHFKNNAFKNPQLPTIVKANWTAVISLCSDDCFKENLSDFLHSSPTPWVPITVAEPGMTLPLTTIPYYALMGDLRDNRNACSLAISRSQLLRRQRGWAEMLQTLPPILKSDPLIFLGTGSIAERVCEFINELLKLQPQIPKRLVFLENDSTPRNAVFKNLVGSYCEVDIADCTLTELSNSLSREALPINSASLFSESTKSLVDPKIFLDIEDQVAYVPRREEVRANPAEHNRLLDLLFRPTHLDWAPYAFGLQFRREICTVLTDKIKEFSAAKGARTRVIHVKGEAGIGKTVNCRSVAFDLAQEKYLCLWLKRSYGELSGSRFETVVKKLNVAIQNSVTEVVFFLDDPAGSRIALGEVTAALARAQFRWTVVVSTRKTDEVSSKESSAGSISAENCLDVPIEFTANELACLPEYLVKLGIAPSIEIAKNRMIPPGLSHSKDVLCSLWYLLPQTHAAIEDSLVGEYRRLGDVEEYVQQFANAVDDTRSIAKAAYELVTTTSGFDNIALPVEVLVSALRISYAEWDQQCKEKKPLWGLLYDEAYPSAETYAYRTRNFIVTDVLLRTLNHGTAGHTGEFRCLKRLLGACSSAAPQYKTFLWDVLVNRRPLIEKRFTYVQAMELYDIALASFPKSLGVVEHQRAIVRRHLGGDAQEAYDELKRLISKTHDRGVPDQDSPDNLHTSAAAALNQLIKEERVDPAVAAETVYEHVTSALSVDQFSLHSYHIHAHTLLTIAACLRNTNQVAFMANLERAARITGRALLLVQQVSELNRPTRKVIDSLQLFQDLREEILLAHPEIEKAQLEAKELFRLKGDQTGFAFIARVLLTKATSEGKGHAYKKVDDYIRDCVKLIDEARVQISDELLLCRIELTANWQLNQNKGPIFWEQFQEDLVRIVRKPRYASDVMWTFYLGVAEYNQAKFSDAEGRFQWLRSQNVPWQMRQILRCFYLGEKSAPKIFEGQIRAGSYDRFIYSAELGNDVRVGKDEFAERPDEVKAFKIGFSFFGATAVERNS